MKDVKFIRLGKHNINIISYVVRIDDEELSKQDIERFIIDDETWKQNIAQRNKRVEEGNGSSDFYLDEGLMKKLESKWEEPSKEEIDVWYPFVRNK